MKGKDIISIKECPLETIQMILALAKTMKKDNPGPILKGHILASCFFESSTRTRLSFESAMKRLGGDVIGFAETTSTSSQKGESLYDMMKVMGYYSDLVVIRHPREGSARVAAEACDKPVINAGDGANEHPSQTLLDLFTIEESQSRLRGLNIAFVGDLLYGRTVHSLAPALGLFDNRFYFVAPAPLTMPEPICQSFRQKGIPFSFHHAIEEIIDKVDILYITRIQKERFASLEEYLKWKDHFMITPELLRKSQPHLKILHPLPRVNEIALPVDRTPHAHYFPQAENGLWVRQAMLKLLLLGE